MSTSLPIEPLAAPPDADIVLPGSKSLTNRAVIAASLASGRSELVGVLFADDTDAMLDCVAQLGPTLSIDRSTHTVVVDGGGGDLAPGPIRLDARLSGTTARFLLPMLGLGVGPYLLDGAAPLRDRPMAASFDALRQLGADIVEEGEVGHLPVRVRGPLIDGPHLTMTGDVSSQFLSGLLLSAPVLARGLTVRVEGPQVSQPYVAMTLAVMRAFGAIVEETDSGTYRVGGGGYVGTTYAIEPDASTASYFFAAAAIGGGRVRVEGLGPDTLQGDLGFVDLLERMGATVHRGPTFTEVVGTGSLHGIQADLSDLSDTAQTLGMVAVFADTPTEVTGIGFIRRKETDRIAAVVTELRRCGIDAEETDDGFVVAPGTPRPARIETYDDHRMAMSFALLGLRTPGIEILDPECVTKTFPDYFEVLDELRRPRAGRE